MSRLCEEFGISRKTGYKIVERYQRIGVKELTDRSRRPNRHANQLPVVVEKAIVGLDLIDNPFGPKLLPMSPE